VFASWLAHNFRQKQPSYLPHAAINDGTVRIGLGLLSASLAGLLGGWRRQERLRAAIDRLTVGCGPEKVLTARRARFDEGNQSRIL
jgi:hypothetical protein